jgi:uridylate kinase
MSADAPKYKRILLKLSGEALMGGRRTGIDAEVLATIADELVEVQRMGIEIAIVIGGGNIFRGVTGATQGIDRVAGDHMGMLATVINALALQDAIEQVGADVRTQTAIPVQQVAEPYIRRRAVRHLEKHRVVIFAAGTGNPFMTTDTAAALRAVEIDAEILLMSKNRVDGVYDADPASHPEARRFTHLTYMDALSRRLEVMDSTALSLCMENELPILVFDVASPDGIVRAVAGEEIGTRVASTPAEAAPAKARR